MTINKTILEFLANGEFQYGGVIEVFVRDHLGSKGETTSRVCRLMAKAGVLEKRLIQIDSKGPRVVQYRISQEYASSHNSNQTRLFQ